MASEYNKQLHEVVKHCKKAIKNETETTLFSDLLTHFDRLLGHYEALEKKHLKCLNQLSDLMVLKYNLQEVVTSSQKLIDESNRLSKEKE